MRYIDPLRIILRFPRIHRLFHRPKSMDACIVCRYVWRRLLAEPGFAEGLEQGRRDFEEGRTVRYTVDELRDEA